jgi:hypothetical protein
MIDADEYNVPPFEFKLDGAVQQHDPMEFGFGLQRQLGKLHGEHDPALIRSAVESLCGTSVTATQACAILSGYMEYMQEHGEALKKVRGLLQPSDSTTESPQTDTGSSDSVTESDSLQT